MATQGLRAAGTAQRNVFPAASREGLTAARKIPFQSRRRRIKQLPFMNSRASQWRRQIINSAADAM